MTSAYRSKLYLDKQGLHAAVVEHRIGKFRVDLFRVFDVLAFLLGWGILTVQSYEYKDRKKHEHLTASHPVIAGWLAAGGRFCHHVWHRPTKKLRKWTIAVRWIT